MCRTIPIKSVTPGMRCPVFGYPRESREILSVGYTSAGAYAILLFVDGATEYHRSHAHIEVC